MRADAPDPFRASGANTDGRFEMIVLEVGYLSGPPLHSHKVQEDSFYVLEGTLTAQLGDEIVELRPGDFATAPPGVAHTFTNTYREHAARMVNVMTPGIGFDRYIAAALSGADAAEMDDLGQQYGVTMIGPRLSEKLGLE